MAKHHVLIPFLLVLLAFPTLAMAEGPKVELTPFYGFRLDGEIDVSSDFDFFDPFFDDLTVENGDSFGFIAGFAVSRHFMFELMLSHQETTLKFDRLFFFEEGVTLLDLDVDYYHAGFSYRWTPGQVHPFLGLSVGLTRFDSDGFDGGSSLDRPSASIGGGAKIFLTDHIGFRFEGRAFWTFIDDDVDDLCDFDCGFRDDDSVFLVQPEVRAGLIFAF